MRIHIKSLVIILILAHFAGCSSMNKMPVRKGMEGLDTSKKSILLGKLTIKNKNKPAHQPNLSSIHLTKDGKVYSYLEPDLISDHGEDGKEYIISIDVEPGRATIENALFIRAVPPFISASADLPFEQEVDIPENKIIYIGNIEAVIRARETDEPRAGLIVPLVDQYRAGFSSGTFDVKITDQYESDIKEIMKIYPYLAKKEIKKDILPEWKYPEPKKSEPPEPVNFDQY